jgi:CubicO group peptidase (beta-lactamase class C family)
VEALATVEAWDVASVAVAVVAPDGTVSSHGEVDQVFRIASLSKVLTTYAALIAIEEGSVSLDDPVGPPGATLRHLLAHTAGYGFDGARGPSRSDDADWWATPHPPPAPIAAVGRRRIYSNAGMEVAAQHLAERTDMPFEQYLREAVLEPLDMRSTVLRGSPAYAMRSTTADLLRFVEEIRHPSLIDVSTLAEATTVQFPGLNGVVPGIGRQDPCDWGLGFEVRDHKRPHWTGTRNSPETFGHFGGAGTFVWVDPAAGVAMVCLTDREFGDWALAEWPPLSDAVLAEVAGT